MYRKYLFSAWFSRLAVMLIAPWRFNTEFAVPHTMAALNFSCPGIVREQGTNKRGADMKFWKLP
jgi:hypothetical protein